MDSMIYLMRLLKLVQAQRFLASDTMKEHKYPSAVYMEAKGSYNICCIVETYIRTFMLQKTKKEKEEVEDYERID